jgi:hypothetical protein
MTEARSLSDQIEQLSPDQAQRAVLNLYEQLPDQLWIDDTKWPLTDMSIRAAMLQEVSPESVQPFLSGLIEPGNESLKAQMARVLLLELAGEASTAHYVSTAVEAAQQPDMLPIPLIIGAVIIFLAIVPTKIKTKNIEIQFRNIEQLQKLARTLLPEIVKKSGFSELLK